MPSDPFAATAYEMLAGGLAMLPFGLVNVGSVDPLDRLDARVAVPRHDRLRRRLTAYTWLLAHAPLGTVSTYAYMNPVVAIL